MSEDGIVAHLNEHGMILHMECLGKIKPFLPKAQCLGKTISEVLPGDIGEQVKPTIKLALEAGPSDSAFAFSYVLENKTYHSRVTYLSPGVVLVVIQ